MFAFNNAWPQFTFEFNPSQRDAPAGSLLIGLGDGNDTESQKGVALNNKGYRAGHYNSVSELVANADDRQWTIWRSKLSSVQGIQRIVIEDFSLDTCFTLLLFLNHLNAVGSLSLSTHPWLEYVTAWESGIYLDGDDTARSAACLLSALAHSSLCEQSLDDTAVVRHNMLACLRLLSDMIIANPDPTAGIMPMHTQCYASAVASLAYEQQIYQHIIKRSVTCQLLLDLGTGRRQTVVDALFITETLPSGMLKILARCDKERSWTHNGFGLLAIYRPREVGTGNDIVISLNPIQGTRLDALWSALEQREDAAWQGVRPHDTPRFLESYRLAGSDKLIPGAPNQPWYDAQGRMTLIAAPKQLAPGEPGSKLTWQQDVLPAIWENYFTRYLDNAIVPIVLPELDCRTKGKCIRVYQHRIPEGGDITIVPLMRMIDTPTFHAWLAAQSDSTRVVRSPADLPPASEYSSQWYSNILVVAHRHGVTFFCREEEDKHLAILIKAASSVADVSHEYENFLANSGQQIEQWLKDLLESQQIHNRKGKIRRLSDWSEMMLETKARALKAMNKGALVGNDALHNQLSDDLSRQWGLSEQRQELMAQIEQLDQLMRQAISQRQEKRQRIYGALFSALALGAAANHIWEPIKEIKTTNLYEWQLMLFKEQPAPAIDTLQAIAADAARYEVYTLAILLIFGFIGFILFWFFDFNGKEE